MSSTPSRSLPRRDIFLLPLISLMTVAAMLAGGELIARTVWSEAHEAGCYRDDPVFGYRNKPDCVSRRKSPEGPMVEYRYNECGYRSNVGCGAKPAGSVRIVMLGDSFTEGSMVPYDQVLTTVAGVKLSQACRRPVEVQNMATAGFLPFDSYLRVKEALSLDPDLVAMTLVPADLIDLIPPERMANRHEPLKAARAKAQGEATPTVLGRLRGLLRGSRAALVAQHFLFRDSELYARLYLARGEDADYLRAPFSPAWEKRFADFELVIADMAAELRAAGKPLLLVVVPQRVQAAMLGRPALEGIDPLAFSRRIAEIADRHGILIIDTFDELLRRNRRPEDYYYPVDGHMAGDGHMVVGEVMAKGLAHSTIPVFQGCGSAP